MLCLHGSYTCDGGGKFSDGNNQKSITCQSNNTWEYFNDTCRTSKSTSLRRRISCAINCNP